MEVRLARAVQSLLDEHFPLFITYDQYGTSDFEAPNLTVTRIACTMLENDIGLGNRSNVSQISLRSEGQRLP